MSMMIKKNEPAGKRLRKYFQSNWQLWVMLLPAMVYIFVFCYMPMYGVQLAFREYSFTTGITGGKFVGLQYFRQYIESPMFFSTLKNTFVISATSILVGFPAPILLAMIINQIRGRAWKRTLQTTVYIPYFISVVVMVSMLNIMFANQSGVVANLLKDLHLVSDGTNILGSESSFVPLYVLSGVWQSMGWHIDLPTILPTVMILLIMNMGNILNVGFDKVYLMQNSLNMGVSQVISTYVYTVGIKSSQFSFGAAVGLFNTVINFVFLLATNYVSKRTPGTGLM